MEFAKPASPVIHRPKQLPRTDFLMPSIPRGYTTSMRLHKDSSAQNTGTPNWSFLKDTSKPRNLSGIGSTWRVRGT